MIQPKKGLEVQLWDLKNNRQAGICPGQVFSMIREAFLCSGEAFSQAGEPFPYASQAFPQASEAFLQASEDFSRAGKRWSARNPNAAARGTARILSRVIIDQRSRGEGCFHGNNQRSLPSGQQHNASFEHVRAFSQFFLQIQPSLGIITHQQPTDIPSSQHQPGRLGPRS